MIVLVKQVTRENRIALDTRSSCHGTSFDEHLFKSNTLQVMNNWDRILGLRMRSLLLSFLTSK